MFRPEKSRSRLFFAELMCLYQMIGIKFDYAVSADVGIVISKVTDFQGWEDDRLLLGRFSHFWQLGNLGNRQPGGTLIYDIGPSLF